MTFTSLEVEFSKHFIKSIPVLAHLDLTANEIKLIELVLSFTRQGNPFYMNYEDIADRLVVMRGKNKNKVVGNIIRSTKQKGYIATKNSKNFNGKNGGSSTTISVNEPFLEAELHRVFNAKKQMTSQEETIQVTAQQPMPIVPERNDFVIPVEHLVEVKEMEAEILENVKPKENHHVNTKEIKQKESEAETLSFIQELEEMDDNKVMGERLECLSYDDDDDINSPEPEIKKRPDAQMESYKSIDNIPEFVGLMQRLIRRDDLQGKKSNIQYLIDLAKTKDLEYLKDAFKALVLDRM